jgi:hypothetical protein
MEWVIGELKQWDRELVWNLGGLWGDVGPPGFSWPQKHRGTDGVGRNLLCFPDGRGRMPSGTSALTVGRLIFFHRQECLCYP